MSATPKVNLSEYNYHLPDDRIAKYPLPERDQSKLLYYHDDIITDKKFTDMPSLLPSGSTLVFNNTKVIPARLFFQRATRATIEIFLLHPLEPSPIVPLAMEAKGQATWDCMIGNAKRWKEDSLVRSIMLGDQTIELVAMKVGDRKVKFSWNNDQVRFVDIVEEAGQVPLPPYLNRALYACINLP